MNIVKKIARWLLQEELNEEKRKHQLEIDNLIIDKKVLETSNEDLRKLAFGNTKVLVSQTMLKCISEMLPDPNKVGVGNITSEDLKIRNMCFVNELRGRQYKHDIRFIKALAEGNNINGLMIHISDYEMDIFIPLRREHVSYKIYGVSSSIDTYFWDFYRAGIRMVSDEAWAMSIEFYTAQRNVLKEFKEEGLL